MQEVDWITLASEVALEILGEPKSKTSTHWRWGNKGSMALDTEKGLFFDFEGGEGYSCHRFITEHGKDLKDVLRSHGYDTEYDGQTVAVATPNPVKVSRARTFDKFQMQTLANDAVIKVQYSETFWVMRFEEGHQIKQKYAPFTKDEHGTWAMARPEAPLPIYLSEGDPDKPLLIVEGEKAMRGAARLYSGQVCCHHGGVNNWKEGKSDWQPIYGRTVLIWPDNDEAGLQMAVDLKSYLSSKKCQVEIVKIPEDFADKDDLFDAAANNYFESNSTFEAYLFNNADKAPRGSFELLSIEDMQANIKEPEWLIDKILERETIGSIFGQPKSGKSLISLSMMLAIANGSEWFGHATTQTPAVLFCGEGERSMHKRILAWSKYQEADLKGRPFRMSNRPARILDDADFGLIMQTLKNAHDEMGDIGVVCIDTLQRNFGGGDENSSSDMGKFIQRVDEIKYEFKCCVAMVHHTGHVGGGNRARGSSVLPSSVDFEFKVDRNTAPDDETRMYTTIKQTLNKEGSDLPAIHFEVVPVHNLKGYISQTSATIDLTDYVPGLEAKVPENLMALNDAITIVHSEKAKALGDPYKAMVSIEDIVKYLDDEKKSNSWVSKNITRYKDHKSHCWVSAERGSYHCEDLLNQPF
tara:strand:+ start:5535 stop:7451 length:1917 start_codon:yes stop_codon:yes gene_type:complete